MRSLSSLVVSQQFERRFFVAEVCRMIFEFAIRGTFSGCITMRSVLCELSFRATAVDSRMKGSLEQDSACPLRMLRMTQEPDLKSAGENHDPNTD